ncbi:MAG: zinc ribbon domain-containing protein [bacterium]
MPIYEYRCAGCGRVFENLRERAAADSPAPCPGCGKPAERILSAPAGIRMGTGHQPGSTCCGRDERCDSPPCSGGACGRD